MVITIIIIINYATKAHLKNAARFDTSKFAKKVDLASFKSEADKWDIDKLGKVPTGLKRFRSKVDKLDNDRLAPLSVDWDKLSDVIKDWIW